MTRPALDRVIVQVCQQFVMDQKSSPISYAMNMERAKMENVYPTVVLFLEILALAIKVRKNNLTQLEIPVKLILYMNLVMEVA